VTDIVKLALAVGRAEFVAMHPMPFLAGSNTMTQYERPTLGTALEIRLEWSDLTSVRSAEQKTPPPQQPPTLAIFPIRKVQPIFPNMITVGRTSNNDIVLADASVSKFHAYFEPQRSESNDLLLSDAASTNGTFVDEQRIAKDGPGVAVSLRSQIRFGKVSFALLDAGACWDLVNRG
jgi:hypothetical protein